MTPKQIGATRRGDRARQRPAAPRRGSPDRTRPRVTEPPEAKRGAGVAVSGAGSITLTDGATSSATSTGSGFVLLADPTNHDTLAISGSGVATLTGDVDLPFATVSVAGNSRLVDSAGQTVVGQLTASGSSVVSIEGAP